MDAVVLGSGPNGLAAAITLARAGCSVAVLEEQATIGGGARSAELTLPGFIHDSGSAIHPLGAGSPCFCALPLARHGLEWVHPEIPLAHPLEDGTAAVLYRSLAETAAGLGSDGNAYRRLMEPLVERWDALASEFLQPMLHLPRHPFLLARFGLQAIQPAAVLARRMFRHDRARALFAGLAAHSFLPLDAPMSAGFALVLGAAGHAVGWPFPRGGAQRISDALAGCLREFGGTIETGRRINDLREAPPARVVMLDLTAWQAARLNGSRLPQAYRWKLERFPHGPAVFKIDYALAEPIPWRSGDCRRAGTVHLGGTLGEVSEGERQVADGRVADRPFVLLAQQSLFDRTRAPGSQETAWAYCHVPRGCVASPVAALEAQIERFAPGFRECILARSVTAPAQLEATNANLVEGDISGGASDFWSLLARPALSPTPYRTPVKGLYLCSSSTPPGGGVHGMCGYHAARAALRRELR